MTSRVVIVDPRESAELAELADLSGVPWVRMRAWPFELADGDRVVTSIPVPAGARADALGVHFDGARSVTQGEAWPDLTVPLAESRAQILAHMAGANVAPRTRIGVFGMRGGVGATYLAACMARTAAHHPLSVSLVSSDPASPLPEWTKQPEAWSRIALDGPLLPNRLAENVPLWRRVRVVAGQCPSADSAFAVSAALSRCHDLVIEDRGRLVRTSDVVGLDGVVVVFSGERSDVDVWESIADGIDCPVISVARTYPTGTVYTPADLADYLGANVIEYAHERGARLAPRFGGEPGDRRRGSGARAAGQIVAQILESL